MEPNAPTPIAPVAPAAPEPVAPIAPTPGISNSPAPIPEPIAAPVEPAPAPAEVPLEPAAPQPAPTALPTTEPKKLTYEEYLDSLVGDIPTVELPKPTDVPADDPDGLVKFFDDYGNKLMERMAQEQQRTTRIQEAEAKGWGDAFAKYPEIKDNAKLRDIVQNIRVGAFQNNQSMTPLEASEQLVDTLHNEYRKGQDDQRVTTQIVASQPLGGGSTAPVASTVNYQALQDGGRNEAVNQIEALMRDGKI